MKNFIGIDFRWNRVGMTETEIELAGYVQIEIVV